MYPALWVGSARVKAGCTLDNTSVANTETTIHTNTYGQLRVAN